MRSWKCRTYRNLQIQKRYLPCDECVFGWITNEDDGRRYCKRIQETACVVFNEKLISNCRDCPYDGYTTVHDMRRCFPCCRGLFDGKLKCAGCDGCPGGTKFDGKSLSFFITIYIFIQKVIIISALNV